MEHSEHTAITDEEWFLPSSPLTSLGATVSQSVAQSDAYDQCERDLYF